MYDASLDSREGGCSCPRCIRDPARVENWLNESGPSPSEVGPLPRNLTQTPRNSRIQCGNCQRPTRSGPPSRSLVPISEKDFSHVPTAHAFTLRAEYEVFKNDCRMASGPRDQISIPSPVEKYFSEIFDEDSRALEDFLRDFKTVGYRLKEELCNIHRGTVLFGHPDYTLYDGNPKPDQQSPYHDCKFNPDHLLVNNSSFEAWRDESTINIVSLMVPSPEQTYLSG
jgi:hypothetical protein